MNVPGPADLRLVLAVARLREAAERVPVVAASSAASAVFPLAVDVDGPGQAPRDLPAPALARPAAQAGAPASPDAADTDAVDVSPRARLLAALDQAGTTAARAASAASAAESVRTTAATEPAPAPGSPASAAAPAPATAPVAAPIPAWLPAAIATVHFEAVAPPEDEAHGKQEPGEPEPVLRARLTAELPALGSIAIDVRLDSGAVRVSLAAADESGPVLRSGAAELAQALGARGLVLARHEVTHG